MPVMPYVMYFLFVNNVILPMTGKANTLKIGGLVKVTQQDSSNRELTVMSMVVTFTAEFGSEETLQIRQPLVQL